VGSWAGAFNGLLLLWFMGWWIDGFVGGGLVPLQGFDMFSNLYCPIYQFLHFRTFLLKGVSRVRFLPVPRMDWEMLIGGCVDWHIISREFIDGLLDWWIVACIHTFYHHCNEFPIHAWIDVIHFMTKRASRVTL
jgi:hypothetical protein